MEGLLQYGQAAWQPGRTSTGPAEYPSNGLKSKTQPTSPFKGGEPAVHHERAARALDRLGILCYDVAKPMKECGCQETVFTNSLVGTKTGGRPPAQLLKAFVGHSESMDTFGVYGHEVAGEKRRAAKIIDNVFERIIKPQEQANENKNS